MNGVIVVSMPRAGGTALVRMLGGSGEDRGQFARGRMARRKPLAVGKAMRLTAFGHRSVSDAMRRWSWLLEAHPGEPVVLLTREIDDRYEMSMTAAGDRLVPSFGKCWGCLYTRAKQMRGHMEDFHEMNPTRTILLDHAELEDFEALAGKLGEWAPSREAWERLGAERPNSMPEEFKRMDAGKAALERDGDDPFDDGDPFRGEVVHGEVANGEVANGDGDGDEDPFRHAFDAARHLEGAPARRRPREVIELRPRGDLPTLSVSIMAHPKRAGWVEELREFFGGCPVAMDDGRGLIANGARAWELHDPEADYHLVIQDDAVPCADFLTEARNHLAKLEVPGAVSFYFSGKRPFKKVAAGRIERGEARGRLRWGPAIALPTSWIPAMLRRYRRGTRAQYDARIGDWLKSAGVSCFYPLPSLVDHRGTESLLGNGHRGKRRAAFVRGAEVTASHRAAMAMPDAPRAIVYPWWSKGAAWEELRHSLRSVERYFEDKECPIYILTDKAPDWIKPGGRVRVIELDGYKRKQGSGMWQAREIGLQLAERVLWMNDDFYLLKPTRWEDFATALHAGDITDDLSGLLEDGKGFYRNMARAGMDLLREGALRVLRFSTHTPQVYEREKSLEVLRRFHVPFSGGFETLYHNFHGTPCRLIDGDRASSLPAKFARFLNHGKDGPNEATRGALAELFPVAAAWERGGARLEVVAPVEEARVSTQAGLATVSTMWHGRRLSPLARLTLKAWLDHGHPVQLFAFRDLTGVPEGVVVEDAAAIAAAPRPGEDVRLYSDRWRFHFLAEHGGTWIDADCPAVRPLPELGSEAMFFPETGKWGGGLFAGLIHAPEPGHRAMMALRDFYRGTPEPKWYAFCGEFVRLFGKGKDVLHGEPGWFTPLAEPGASDGPTLPTMAIYDGSVRLGDFEKSWVLHLIGSYLGNWERQAVRRESLIGDLVARHFPGVEVGRFFHNL